MGLERAAACLQGVPTNYHIDTLKSVVQAAADVCGVTYQPETDTGRRLRRITDHVRPARWQFTRTFTLGRRRRSM